MLFREKAEERHECRSVLKVFLGAGGRASRPLGENFSGPDQI